MVRNVQDADEEDATREHVTIKVWVETRMKLNRISAFRTAQNPSGIRVPMTEILDEMADRELARIEDERRQ